MPTVLLHFLKSLARGVGSGAPATPSAGAPGGALRYARGGRIIAFLSTSQGDALREGMYELLVPLRAHCSDVMMIDTIDPAWQQSLAAATDVPVWFAVSNFGLGEFHDAGDGTMTSRWARAGVPFIRLYGDVPAYLPPRHFQHLRNSINAYAHDEHRAFFQRWFRPNAPTVWLPFYPTDVVPLDSVDIQAKAAGAIVFPKNGNCPERLRQYWRSELPESIARALEAVGEDLVAALDDEADLGAAAQAYYVRLGIDLSEDRQLLFFLVAQLDDYLRRIKSTLIARSLLDLPVIIRGSNWDHVDFSGRRARHDPAFDYVGTRRVLDRSLAIVDMSPNTEGAPHDRVLRAAGRYTAFVTNRTKFYTDSFANAAAFTFRFRSEAIRSRVEAALARPRETVEMGIEQGARMRELLTHEQYIEQIVATIDACALPYRGRPAGTQSFVEFPRAD